MLGQAVLEQGRCHTLSSLRSCCPCPPAEPWLAPPAGAEQDPTEAWLPVLLPGGGCTTSCPLGRAVPRASPCHTPRSAEQSPWLVSLAPWLPLPSPGRVDHRAIPSYPRGICHRAGRTLVRLLPPPCTQSQAWKTCKENTEAWSPGLTQQLCPLPVLHEELTQGLGLGFTHLVDPGALNKQLFGVFVCSKKVLLQSVEAKHTKCSKSPV